jgi:hypothetical protein
MWGFPYRISLKNNVITYYQELRNDYAHGQKIGHHLSLKEK